VTKVIDAEIAVAILQPLPFENGNGGHVHRGTVGLDPEKRCFEGSESPVPRQRRNPLVTGPNRAASPSCRCLNIETSVFPNES
jgi:hypothetical protein